MNKTLSSESICIIGNLNIDLIIRNVPNLPAWGQESIGTDRLQVSSGQAGYLAFALRGLGVSTSLIANVGEDLYGKQIFTDLEASGVNTSGITVTAGQNTGITVAIVRTDGERAFVSDLGCLRKFSEGMIIDNWQLVEQASIVCLVGLFCIPGLSLTAAARQLGRARQLGKTTMLDTGWDAENWTPATLVEMRNLLKEVSIFIPNWDEARAITGSATVEDAARCLQQMGPQTVVIKCGEKGSYALHDGQVWQTAPRAVRVYDAVGAGDVFNSGFLFGLMQNWPIEACLAFGNTTASLYISRQNDRFPHLEEVVQVSQEYPVMTAVKILTGGQGEIL
jgi:sugar/nucleoside kinase (ribokinase family)